MMKRCKQVIGVLSVLSMLTACQKDLIHTLALSGNGELRLSGVNAQQMQVHTRAEAQAFFPAHTLYRVWAYKGASEETGNRECQFNVTGYDVESGSEHYIGLPDNTDLFFEEGSEVIDFYGLTDLMKKDDGKPVPDDYLDMNEADEENPVYVLKKEETEALADVRYAAKATARKGESYVIPLRFKHILSKVNFEIVQQVKEGGEGMFGRLTLEGISVPGQPAEGRFDIKEGNFTQLGGSADDYAVPFGGESPVEIGTIPKEVGHVLLFPMIAPEIDETNMLKVSVTLGCDVKETLEKFAPSGSSVTSSGGKYTLTLTCPVYAVPTIDGEGNPVTGKPLRLEPNYEYTIQFMIMNNDVRIITFVPRVYEWLDGEGNEENGFYEEQDLGQPITFNGVMWSDRNLGASSAHPLENVEDWMKSVGYYYQYDRNIPYFPNVVEDGVVKLDSPLEEALKQNNFIYPVVNYAAWGIDAYPGIDSQLKPKNIDDNASGLVSEIGKLPDEGIIPLFNFDGTTANFQTRLWENPETQPCPKGWRLPTEDDIYGIIPKSILSGNITFRIIQEMNAGSGGFNAKENTKEYDFNSDFSKEKIVEMPKLKGIDYMTDEDGKEVLYLGEFPCIYREEKNDPQDGAVSCYVLSMHDDDWNMAMDAENVLHEEGYVYNYGVIYGLKNKGTDKAYRIKWELKLIGKFEEVQNFASKAKKHCTNGNTTQYDGKTAKKYEDGLRGVVVISRFTSSKDDHFDAKDGSYEWVAERKDWSNPVDVMYLPICGVAGNWSKGSGPSGRMYNIGTEGWYATSVGNGDKKEILWIKTMGSNSNNQAIFYAKGSPKHDAVSIRPVRDN